MVILTIKINIINKNDDNIVIKPVIFNALVLSFISINKDNVNKIIIRYIKYIFI